MDAAEHGPRRPGRPEGEDLIEADEIGGGFDPAAREQRLRLGGEEQVPVRDGVEEWTHTEPIARQQDRFGPTIVNRERELPVQAAQHPGAPLLVRVHQHFRIAAGAEAMPGGRQLGPQLEVVVDLAVVDDEHRAVFIPEGLRPTGHVDDAEAHVCQADARAGVAPAAVRTPMAQRARHAVQDLGGDAAPSRRPSQPCEPAHQAWFRQEWAAVRRRRRSWCAAISETGSTKRGGRCR